MTHEKKFMNIGETRSILERLQDKINMLYVFLGCEEDAGPSARNGACWVMDDMRKDLDTVLEGFQSWVDGYPDREGGKGGSI